jgi:hypothetical protein
MNVKMRDRLAGRISDVDSDIESGGAVHLKNRSARSLYRLHECNLLVSRSCKPVRKMASRDQQCVPL